MCHLIMEICLRNTLLSDFCHCENIIEYTYINLGGRLRWGTTVGFSVLNHSVQGATPRLPTQKSRIWGFKNRLLLKRLKVRVEAYPDWVGVGLGVQI